jgi:RND superfamily putative drug exporter
MASFAQSRPWRVVIAAVAFLAVAVVVGTGGLGGLSSGGFDDPSSEGVRTQEVVEAASGASEGASLIALVSPGEDVRSGAGAAAVADVAAKLRGVDGVVRVVSPADGTDAAGAQISSDGRQAYLVAVFRAGDEAADEAVLQNVKAALAGTPGVSLGGQAAAEEQIGETIGSDIARAELIAFPILFLISLFVFRGFVAALLPPMVGVVAILGGFLGVSLANEVTTMSVYAVNLVIALGLGLAIDYALLIVSRYREEIARSGPGREALVRTMTTAGRSVVFSSLTVAVAMAGLMVFPMDFLFSMGLGGVFVSLMAAVAALTILPAVLALLGQRVNAGAPKAWKRTAEDADKPVTEGFWYRLSRGVMKRPGRVALAAATVMIVLGLPALGVTFTTPDAQILPTSASARQVSDTLARDFPQDRSNPIVIALRAPSGEQGQATAAAFAGEVAAVPGVRDVGPPERVGDGVWRIEATPAAGARTDESQTAVAEIRDLPSTATEVLVGGTTALLIDQKDSLAAYLPWAILITVVGTIVLLFLMTGSVVLALKTVVMNFLTIAATLGLLTVIFQEGWGEGIFGFDSLGAVSTTQPILIAVLAFGLSTDYGVFLLARIKEARDSGLPDREAVAVGLQRTGRIVTAAALLFIVAIGAFATSQIVIIKELGVGAALAVALDATIVRALLVPSLMALLGRWNWWAPRPLARLHARFGLNEHGAEAPPAKA